MGKYTKDEFASRIPLEFLNVLLDLGHEFSFDPMSSIESEQYFCNLIEEFNKTAMELHSWLRQKITQDFHYFNSPPKWVQNPDWQYFNNKPMIFVGQMEFPSQITGLHDEAVFYVFWDKETGKTKTIIQIA